MVLDGRKWAYNPAEDLINLGMRYGYFKEINGKLRIFNKIFEIRLTNYFTVKKELEQNHLKPHMLIDGGGIVENGIFNMEMCIKKFSQHFHKHYSKKDQAFIEREGRMLFLMFLSPVLNGRGFPYIESQTADGTQTDIIVTFINQQCIIELKIRAGQKKHDKAYEQLLGYMDKLGLDEGYLLTFNFNKKKELKHSWTQIDKTRKVLDVII